MSKSIQALSLEKSILQVMRNSPIRKHGRFDYKLGSSGCRAFKTEETELLVVDFYCKKRKSAKFLFFIFFKQPIVSGFLIKHSWLIVGVCPSAENEITASLKLTVWR